MTELAYRLTAADLAAYQLAVRDRLLKQAPTRWWERDTVRALALLGLVILAAFAVNVLVAGLDERPMEPLEYLLGLFVGGALVLAVVWVTNLDQRRRIARPDGPILGSQTLRLTPDGVAAQSAHCDVLYRWAGVEAVTEARGLVILWIEPGAGMAVPGHAFASDATRTEFVREVEARRSAAGLPRSGTFS
jgi:hypothetical protein